MTALKGMTGALAPFSYLLLNKDRSQLAALEYYGASLKICNQLVVLNSFI